MSIARLPESGLGTEDDNWYKRDSSLPDIKPYDKSQDPLAQRIIAERQQREKYRRDDSMPYGFSSSKFVGFGDFGGDFDDSLDFSMLSKVLRVPRGTKIVTKEDNEIHVFVGSLIQTDGSNDDDVSRNLRNQGLDIESRNEVCVLEANENVCEEETIHVVTPPGVECIVSFQRDKVEIASDYGPTFVLKSCDEIIPMVCNAVVRRSFDECEIYVYDIISDEFDAFELGYGARYKILEHIQHYDRIRAKDVGDKNYRSFKRWSLYLADFSICRSGIQINYEKFNYFIASSFFRIRDKNNFIFFTGYSKVDVVIRDRTLFLERKRYNSSDLGSQINLGECDFQNCRLQGLLMKGNLLLLMTRIARIGGHFSNTIRYGFSQLRSEYQYDKIALSIAGRFDPLIMKGIKIVEYFEGVVVKISSENKVFKDELKEKEKRRARNERVAKKRKQLANNCYCDFPWKQGDDYM